MKMRHLVEFTVDTANPIGEISAVISEVLRVHEESRLDILRGLDTVIGEALAQLEHNEEGADLNDGND
ncbi:hypothetical protein DET54_106219 [Paenibacillus pabuli]|uniref:Tranposon-transfer assisting protein n=1 Tax=Paenibacillus pabuli TaxID=1472 RepID=A0ABX9BKB1_9BACL|nr:hypothetical protein [Paenibacillus pabuli]RAI96861.1 hypothetical protein DET54_106219 [Paenibacillus pabuli]